MGALQKIEAIVGKEGMRTLFPVVLTDNGSEFSDEVNLGKVFGESSQRETRLYYCDPGKSQQKDHVRKTMSRLGACYLRKRHA